MSSQIEASRRLAFETRQHYATLLTPANLPDERSFARPQFRLVYELTKCLANETNALRGVFSANDFDPQRKWDRRRRELFVQRLVEFVSVNKRPVVGLVAAKVVAGAEPIKTLELLTSIAKIVAQKVSPKSRATSRNVAPGAGSIRPRTVTKQVETSSARATSMTRAHIDAYLPQPSAEQSVRGSEKGHSSPEEGKKQFVRRSSTREISSPAQSAADRSASVARVDRVDPTVNLQDARSSLRALCCTISALQSLEISLRNKLVADISVPTES